MILPSSHLKYRFPIASLALLLLLTTSGLPLLSSPVQASTVDDLNKQKAALNQQALQAQQQADQQKTLAERAADRINQVNSQIGDIQSSMNSTQGDIDSTNDQISEKDQENAALEADLRKDQDQQDALIRAMYIARRSSSDDLLLFSDEPVSKREERQAQFDALQKAVQAVMAKTKQQQTEVASAKAQLTQKKNELEGLKDQQTEQQRNLADEQQQQADLRANAESAEQQLENKAAQAQAQAAQIAQKINLLSSTSTWGNQIISSDDSSWYYTQTGNYTRLGYSSETVNNVGCLITSIAMVSTYYGTRITPTYMAQNGGFSSEGYYYWGTPSGLGVRLRPSGGVNWGVVQSEISAGRPVIVSIYLPSVGSVNSDGSSHYIVIKGYADGKYLMHDPIGPGRSYNLNQVRSMILTSSN